MQTSRFGILVLLVVLGCTDSSSPVSSGAPNLNRQGLNRDTIVVNPGANGNGTARTIQEGVNRAASGGLVKIKPGTYQEAVVIDKGVTLEPIGEGQGEVIISPAGTPAIAVRIATGEPVAIRDLTVLFSGLNGIRGDGVVDATIERVTVRAVNPPAGTARAIVFVNDAGTSGGRARVVVNDNVLDGAVEPPSAPVTTLTSGITVQGDIDGLVMRNTIRRAGGTCLSVLTRARDLGGETNVDVVKNDFDECYGTGGVLLVQAPAGIAGVVTAGGVVNIIGNTIRNTPASRFTATGITQRFAPGRIERNRILGVVQPAAAGTANGNPAGIQIGSLLTSITVSPAITPIVRFNEIVGNAQAGLRIHGNITGIVDATCNWWGAATGPAAAAWPPGTGDAVIVEAGAATPAITPFATSPGDASCGQTWTEPVNLGAVINTDASDLNPNLSPDELSLYFSSSRAGGQGQTDLYVSQRASLTSPWGPPRSLGLTINSPSTDAGASLSNDGHLLFFQSARAGGQGLADIYVSYRTDPHDDFGWQAPVNLGPFVNTAFDEAGAEFIPAEGGSPAMLYFNRSAALVMGQYDIYAVPLNPLGLPIAAPSPVAELNLPAPVSDFGPEVSADGLELLMTSARPGTFGQNDLWVSRRLSVHDTWSRPQNLGPPINTALNDRQASVSADGRVIIFTSTRVGGIGSDDLWMSTRR